MCLITRSPTSQSSIAPCLWLDSSSFLSSSFSSFFSSSCNCPWIRSNGSTYQYAVGTSVIQILSVHIQIVFHRMQSIGFREWTHYVYIEYHRVFSLCSSMAASARIFCNFSQDADCRDTCETSRTLTFPHDVPPISKSDGEIFGS